MKKSNKKQQGVAGTESRPEKVAGLDLGNVQPLLHVDQQGEVMEEGLGCRPTQQP